MKAAADEMQMLGYITTVLGRRTRFNLWEPRFQEYGKPRALAMPYDIAIRMWGHAIIRAGEHKAINYRLQGSAADSIKAGMVKADKAGVFDVIGVPRLQVHDELDFSVIEDSPIQNEAYAEMRHLLETSIKLRVPVIYEYDRAPSWGEIPD
jgi:DNA polymerase I-like protein with 3'-5' exonuclease and polymerase domains